MNIIGLHGFARSGKDTAGQHLVGSHGYTRFACGDPLKKALYILNPRLDNTLTLAQLLDQLGGDWEAAKALPVYGDQLREMMQVFGTEVCRHIFGPDIWVRTLERNVRESGADLVAVTDIRFNEEAQWVVENGGNVYEITRPGVRAVNGHTSEKGIDPRYISATIANDGTIEELGRKIDALIAPAAPVLLAA